MQPSNNELAALSAATKKAAEARSKAVQHEHNIGDLTIKALGPSSWEMKQREWLAKKHPGTAGSTLPLDILVKSLK